MNAITTGPADAAYLQLKDLGDHIMRLKQDPALRAVKVSRATLMLFPLKYPNPAFNTLYGVPIIIDDDLALGEAVPV